MRGIITARRTWTKKFRKVNGSVKARSPRHRLGLFLVPRRRVSCQVWFVPCFIVVKKVRACWRCDSTSHWRSLRRARDIRGNQNQTLRSKALQDFSSDRHDCELRCLWGSPFLSNDQRLWGSWDVCCEYYSWQYENDEQFGHVPISTRAEIALLLINALKIPSNAPNRGAVYALNHRSNRVVELLNVHSFERFRAPIRCEWPGFES